VYHLGKLLILIKKNVIASQNIMLTMGLCNCSPEVDSKDARIRMVNQHREFIGIKAFDGITLYLPRKLEREVWTN